jgi:hypothetical protein
VIAFSIGMFEHNFHDWGTGEGDLEMRLIMCDMLVCVSSKIFRKDPYLLIEE